MYFKNDLNNEQLVIAATMFNIWCG